MLFDVIAIIIVLVVAVGMAWVYWDNKDDPDFFRHL